MKMVCFMGRPAKTTRDYHIMQKIENSKPLIMRFVIWLASILVIGATACHGGGEPSSLLNLSSNDRRAIINLKRLARLDLSHHNYLTGTTRKVEEEEEVEEETKHGLETWQVWALFIVGVVILFLAALIMVMRLKLLASKSSKHALKEINGEEEEERRSELEFFVEREEWFTLEELMEGVADLRSHGFCSSLYTVRLRNDTVYAVKRLRKLKVHVSLQEFGLTMKRVGDMRHPNILPLVCYSNNANTPHEKLLIYRFQTNGSLLNLFQSYAEGERALPWKLRLSIAEGIARGLDFIHRNEARGHGIIKPSNIMLSDEYEPLISEYGYADFVDPAALSMKGYAPPEKAVSEKGDVYSFGVILLELLTGKFLPRWVKEREEWVLDDEISDVGMYAFPLLNLSLKCVALDADDRPTVAQLLQKIQEVVTAQQD